MATAPISTSEARPSSYPESGASDERTAKDLNGEGAKMEEELCNKMQERPAGATVFGLLMEPKSGITNEYDSLNVYFGT